MGNEILDAKWHDLAQRFDAGEPEIVSPPLGFEDAKQMRWAFYRWRAELRNAEKVSRTPMYKVVHRVMVSTILDDATNKWTVRFQVPEASPVFQALDAMTAPHDRGVEE
jgi:hypothetical protein